MAKKPKPTKSTDKKPAKKPAKKAPRKIVVYVYQQSGREIHYLLLNKGGEWQPGVAGNISMKDQLKKDPARAAATREMGKEIGTKPKAMRKIGFVDRESETGKPTAWFTRAYMMEVAPGFVPALSDEHSEYKWAALAEALDGLGHSARFCAGLQRADRKIMAALNKRKPAALAA